MRRSTVAGAVMTMGLALGLVAPPPVTAAPREDARAERDRVRTEAAEVAADIDTAEASVAEVDDALAVLEEHLLAEEATLAAAEDDVAAAEADLTEAQDEIERLEGEIEVLRDEVRERAVQAYVSPPSDDVLTILESKDFTSASARRFYLELRSATDADVNDRLAGALSDLADQEEKAADAKALAEDERDAAEVAAQDVRDAKADQQAVADRLEVSIAENVARSVELATTDRELSDQIAAEQAALLARLANQKAMEEEAARKADAPPPPESPQAPDGSEQRPIAPAPPDVPDDPYTGTGGIRICWTYGIDINCSIEPALTTMLDAAAAEGIVMSGGGYRDPAEQVALRRQNCGTSPYAIYQMPAGQCSPDTAKPGTSNHELGLAVDVSYQGSTLCYGRATCRPGENRAYDWLVANAASFGFYKLRSEAWHWSRTGG